MEKNTDNNKDKVKRAAAISYDPAENDVPILSAFGEGHIAEKIVEVAKESGVPVVPDPNLTTLLSKISVGDEIPPEMYEAVAKILIFVSEIDRSYGEKIKAAGLK
jgi:flagellar biosynthesis protein